MIEVETIRNSICETFCSTVTVSPVQAGYAVSTIFTDDSGDRLNLFIVPKGNSYVIEDSGDYLSTLKASGVDFESGQRGMVFNQILASGSAFWDPETYEIKAHVPSAQNLPIRVLDFISVLLRVREISRLTRDVIKSTFRDDVLNQFSEFYENQYEVFENAPIDKRLSEFEPDLLMRSTEAQSKKAAIYLVSSTQNLLEAQLCLDETLRLKREDVSVFALIESLEKVATKKFQRSQNRGLRMPIFRGDEMAAIQTIGQELGLKNVYQ